MSEMDNLLSHIAQRHGTPCYVYRFDDVKARFAELRAAFGDRFHISYAVKTNPNAAILSRMRGLADTLDISSGGELDRALRAGWPANLLTFTGPAKRDPELESAVHHGVDALVLESVQEARRLNAIAHCAGKIQSVLVRIAPAKVPAGFGISMAGKPSQFGIDEEDLPPALLAIESLPHLSLRGFHIYAGTQCLRPDSIASAWESFIELFRRFCYSSDLHPAKLIFGSGLGICYHEQDRRLDLAPIAGRINPTLDALRREERFAKTDFILETGRFLVGEAGLYLTRIVSRKRSRGAEIAICDGGMNHHNGACGHLGAPIHRNYRMFKVAADRAQVTQPYDLFGPLCTSIDHLAHGAQLPDLNIGDVIAVHCGGAYGLTASPVGFISHPLPREVLVETTGGHLSIEDVSSK
jgi:diaminopimelate decarboxylase